MTVGDLQHEKLRIMTPGARKGRKLQAKPPIAYPLDEDIVARLTSLTLGRSVREPLLLHWRHEKVKGSGEKGRIKDWKRVARIPWKLAGDMSRP